MKTKQHINQAVRRGEKIALSLEAAAIKAESVGDSH
jgi:hypothetical protein